MNECRIIIPGEYEPIARIDRSDQVQLAEYGIWIDDTVQIAGGNIAIGENSSIRGNVKISSSVEIEKSTQIEGDQISISHAVKIGSNVIIQGNQITIGEETEIHNFSRLKGDEISVGERTKINGYMSDSVNIGNSCKINGILNAFINIEDGCFIDESAIIYDMVHIEGGCWVRGIILPNTHIGARCHVDVPDGGNLPNGSILSEDTFFGSDIHGNIIKEKGKFRIFERFSSVK